MPEMRSHLLERRFSSQPRRHSRIGENQLRLVREGFPSFRTSCRARQEDPHPARALRHAGFDGVRVPEPPQC